MTNRYTNLFEPFRIGECEIKNRFTMAPMGTLGMCNLDGTLNQNGIDYYVTRAKGGVGLIVTGLCFVENEIEKRHMPLFPCATINPGNFIRTSSQLTERIHSYNAKIFLQLTAGFGRVAFPGILATNPVAPSAVENKWNPRVMCRELTTSEVERIVKRFADSAFLAKYSGFDGIEVHAVHEGYLLDQFALAVFNRRTDVYGGDLSARLRFASEIVAAIKGACGTDFPVSIRFSVKSYIKGINQGGLPGEEFVELGRDLEEGLEVAKILETAGYDAFSIDAGSYDSWYWAHPPMYFKDGLYLHLSEAVKKVVRVPVLVSGRMDNPDLASRSIAQGKTDALALGRALLADPDLPNKIKRDNAQSIRPCLSCHDGCMGRLEKGIAISCAVNPSVGREISYVVQPAPKMKKVVVVGGGPGGMEAAYVCSLRGHQVTLIEKSDKLGGNLIPGSVPHFKRYSGALIRWFENELYRLKVDIYLNTLATEDMIVHHKPDVLIIATGSQPRTMSIAGAKDNIVFNASQVLLDESKAGQRVLVVGAGLVGCETALWLAVNGKQVTIVESAPYILGSPHPIPAMNHTMLKDLLAYNNVDIITGATLNSVANSTAIIGTKDGTIYIDVDTIVLSIGYLPNNQLYQRLEGKFDQVYVIGDARKVDNIMNAIWDGYEIARSI